MGNAYPMKKGPLIFPLTPAHLFGIGSFQVSAILLFIAPAYFYLPLVLYVFMCAAAPFFPRTSFFLPVISRGIKPDSVSLTFDDGPDPEITPLVLKLLKKYKIKAAFFVAGNKAERYPEIIKMILKDGHEIGNHTYTHDPFIMLKSYRRLESEITGADRVIKSFGIETRAFRPPVGITSPRLWRMLLSENLFCINFSIKACDAGNRRIKNLSYKILKNVSSGDIILLHDVSPKNSEPEILISEFEKLITGIKKKNLDIVPLSKQIGREIMFFKNKSRNPAEAFYDDLGSNYDVEQSKAGVSPARRKEWELFKTSFESNLNKNHNVLELGAGTGRFTVPIAEKVKKVTAVDISSNMLNVLKYKAKQKKLENITSIVSDIEKYNSEMKFDAICSFSALEYISDMEGIIRKSYASLKPGGMVYFITSRRSVFRFFVQIGNAMRQGVWLRARSGCEMKRYLKDSGFTDIQTTGHLFKSVLGGGMLLEIKAFKK
jgi:peptidoglycan/xylan/chitin deacetylase (PgdA/CDA1 family)/ubiquinone/menaquinone biosynthesis C-methylase UbiE